MSMLDSAKWQLNKVLEKCTDPNERVMQEMMNNDVMELLKVFEEQGHSDFSAPTVISLFSILANYRLVTEVEDNPDDWDENGQHKYISSIFKREDGTCYYLYGKCFAEPDSDTFFFSGDEYKTEITFPLRHSDLRTRHIRLNHNIKDVSVFEQFCSHDYRYLGKDFVYVNKK